MNTIPRSPGWWVYAAIGLGATMTLREAWLTVALSLELPALAWIAGRLKLQVLRPVAVVMAIVVLLRLVANPYVADYPIGSVPMLNWILYGYGIPAVAFFAAALRFRRDADDLLVMLLEAGALAFAGLLVTWEIHHLLAGPLHRPPRDLLESSLQSIAWLAMAIGLGASRRWSLRPVPVWGRRILVGLAVAQILAIQMLWENPLWSPTAVGDVPVLNLLLLAYGIPAALLLLSLWLGRATGRLAQAGRVLALVLILLDLSLEVRRFFHGPVLSIGLTTDAEWYAYSAAWLGFAGVLLLLGIRGGSMGVRHGALAVLLVTVGKVFLSDMADLTGLYRVASFVGLGLCLIGVGYLYQRFIFPPRPRPGAEAAGPAADADGRE